jgi:hypothetical protein
MNNDAKRASVNAPQMKNVPVRGGMNLCFESPRHCPFSLPAQRHDALSCHYPVVLTQHKPPYEN